MSKKEEIKQEESIEQEEKQDSTEGPVPEIDESKTNFTIGYNKHNADQLMIKRNNKEKVDELEISIMMCELAFHNNVGFLRRMQHHRDEVSGAMKNKRLQERKQELKKKRSKKTKEEK